MRQALHIHRKDVRQFWKEIALVAASTALFAAVGCQRATETQSLEMAWSSSMLLLPISWWFLISRLIHAEALPGTRPFWMTRPYSWRSLLAAKALFIFVFINVPLFIADTFILERNGFQFVAMLPGLVLRQAMMAVAFLVPSAVLAALTTGIVQMVLALVSLAVGFVVFNWWDKGAALYLYGMPFLALDWLRWLLFALIVAAGGLIILVLQYWKRRTWLSSALGVLCVFGVGFLAVHTPWLWIFNLQSRMSERRIPASEVAVRLNSGLAFATRALFLKGDQVEIEVPIELISPANVSGRIDTLSVYIKASDGTEFQFSSPFTAEGAPKLHAIVPGCFYRKIRNEPLRVEGRAYVTLFHSTVIRMLPNEKRVAIAGSQCSTGSSEDAKTYFLSCASPLRSDHQLRTVRMQVAVDGRTEYLTPGNQYQPISYSPLPADFDLDPVTRREYMAAYQPPFWKEQSETSQPTLKAVEVTTSEPIAHLWTHFEITGPRLSDREVNMLH